ncbi:hypothetical protein BJV78DRAFT_387816 [Lactifluus subvellereus]|nr:hypothetical protein BJV78DRAFT_387816 [Lactifluus subvellereus]
MSSIDEHQLSPPEIRLVKRWWENGYQKIKDKGYRFDKCLTPASASTGKQGSAPQSRRSFNEITKSGIIVSALAHREQDGFPILLTWLPPDSSPKYPGSDPRNHCTPSFGVFVLENNLGSHKIAVTPFLHPFDKFRFKTYLDFLDFFAEICEGIQFMHGRKMAYRACTATNIVWTDPPLVHPVDGTQHPHRYYLFDTGFSCPEDSEMTNHPGGRNGSAHEHDLGDPCNPFQTDIYCTGILVREKFINKFHGLKDMHNLVKLVDEMTHVNPPDRPCIERVVNKLHPIKQNPGVDPLRPLEESSWSWRWLFRA